jgi:peptidoglycan/xylan/chitin deacetylase (PgdA/CDA1 family)
VGPRLAAVSVDLDEIDCYTAIHGLPRPEGEAARAIYARAVPRLEQIFDDEGIRATFFAIGRDLGSEDNRATLRQLADGGHEIANHSYNHLYDLTRRSYVTILEEIRHGSDAIEEATGTRPRGFRAPGYVVSDPLFDALEELGVAWDSSVFPCPVYYSAKLAALGMLTLRGRKSRSIVDDPRVLRAPADPYRVGKPYRHPGAGVFEMPIGVTRDATARLPYIGTFVAASETAARQLTRLVAGRPLVNLELHGIDQSDAEEDGLGFLAPHQIDLRRSARDKEAALRVAIAELRRAGYAFVTLSEAAERLG